MTLPREQGAPAEPSSDQRTDRELLAAHLDGDRDAFTLLVRRHRARLWTYALRSLRDREEAAEALQDAFVRAHRYAGSYRADAEVENWLTRIVTRVVLDKIKARRPSTVPLDEDASGDEAREGRADAVETADAHGEVDAQLTVKAMLAVLPDEQRQAILLVDVQGLSVAETADTLGISVGTVKSRCARGRARLAAALTATGQGRRPR